MMTGIKQYINAWLIGLKDIIQKKIINLFGYKLSKFESIGSNDLNKITKILTNTEEPIIFDVGANLGQSIKRYKKHFPNSVIHSFEPHPEEVKKLSAKYENDNSVFINSDAVGEKSGSAEFTINVVSSHSSFKKIIPGTTWLKKRKKTHGVKEYAIKKNNVKVITLDDYCSKNNINKIDILKIDTQGFESKVLEGAIELLKNNKIKVIEVEVIFSEVYEDPPNMYDIEKFLIPNKYRIFSTANGGSLISDYIYQSDFIYVSSDTYEKFKKYKSPYFNN